MFVLFNGEAFDYIGSSRVVYDMQKKEFPQIPPSTQQIGLEDIDFFIELSQLGLVENSKFYLHSDPNSARDADVRDKVCPMISDIHFE